MRIPDCLTCFLRNLYTGQEVTVRTGLGTTDWFQKGEGICKAVYCHPVYLTYMQSTYNAGLDEAQAEVKIARRNINNLRYADDTTFMAESEEQMSLLMKVKQESEKAGLKLNIHKIKIMASDLIISWQTVGKTMETVRGFIFVGFKNHCRWYLQP